MNKKHLLIALSILILAVANIALANESQQNKEKIDTVNIPRDPVVTDTDKIGGDFNPWVDSAYAYISGKASQLYPPLLYDIEKWAIAYPNCYLVYTTGTPGTTAYLRAWIQAETTCGELYAEIYWIEGRSH
ncbi:hypothetical protein [Pyrococcus horikoshii]|uniref:Uncharacterized protein n=2 Tax=Pyrococcus horikoshii TaxID=53953 RepID=O59164_PYRHO|nr:hypothetical protein [Pyrococcus horikoshii]BAA30602.1 130aa long hypothetical protein [Pyrococcus horikoshii OT3]HII60482.1 hypothetical protein [Pyrococcus horikoshii]